MHCASVLGPRTSTWYPQLGSRRHVQFAGCLPERTGETPGKPPGETRGGNPGRCQEKADQKRSDGRAAGGNGSASAEGRSGEVGHAGIFTPPLIIIVFINFGFSIVISTRCRAQRGCEIDAKYGFEPYSSPASRLGWLINMHVVRALSCQ